MAEMITWPAQVVAAARSYLGVRWHHQGRSRAGVDCAGLVVCIAHDLGLSEFDTHDYGRLPNGDTMRQVLREHCVELPSSALAPGLVVLMRFDADPQHMGIVADYVHGGHSIVHALAQQRRVVEHRLDQLWLNRIVALYALPGVEYSTP